LGDALPRDAGADQEGQPGTRLERSLAEGATRPPDGLTTASECGVAERELAVEDGRAHPIALDLRVVLEHPQMGGVPVLPLLGEVGRPAPGDVDEWLVDVH